MADQKGGSWCWACKAFHPRPAFGKDPSRSDGIARRCLASRRVRVAKVRTSFKRHGWIAAFRPGDKRQARRRVNYLVEQGRIPKPDDLPCIDCGDMLLTDGGRHEYDHAKGYSTPEAQLYVEPVCQRCHRAREETRRAA